MRRNLPILLAFFLGLCIATCNAFGQGISEVLEAAEAATPGPASSQAQRTPAPASGIDKLIADENAAFEKGFALGVAASRSQEIQPDPSQPRIVLTAAQQADAKRNNLTPQQYINVHKQIDEIQAAVKEQKKMLADYLARRAQPTMAAPRASACTVCGPNCRCTPGNCQCRWAGECLGVPDSRIERSVVKPATVQPAIEETIWRPSTSPVRINYVPRRRVSYSYPMYQASYGTSYGSVGGNGSVGGHTGYSYSSYPTYRSGYSSGSAVYCVDQYGNQVPCN